MREEDFVIEKVPVYGRDESTHKLFGWTWGEMVLLSVSVVATQIMFHRRLLTIAAVIVTYLYIRRIKQYLPDRFAANMRRHYMRRHTEYHAGGRDIMWRPPVTDA